MISRASLLVIGMSGAADLRRCLQGVQRQDVDLEVVVVHDPDIDYGTLGAEHPSVRFVANLGQRSPLELVSRGIRETSGQQILVTKDYCVPATGWASGLLKALDGPCGAVGGAVDVVAGDATAWAFSFIDLYRFASPLPAGPTATLTVHNVAYRRRDLEALTFDWRTHFQEAEVHAALAARGPLIAVPDARVTIGRDIPLLAALQERYVFGRIFAAERTRHTSAIHRLALGAGAPAIPALLLGRMVAETARNRTLRRRLATSAAPLSLMLLARAGGEWMGYVTGRPSSRSSSTSPPERSPPSYRA